MKGQIWCSTPEDQNLTVSLPVRKKGQRPQLAVFTCPSNTSLQCDVFADASCATTIRKEIPGVQETTTQVQMGGDVWRMKPGERLTFSDKQDVKREPAIDSSDAWQLPLLALQDGAEGEFQEYMQRLLAPIGMTKSRHMNEI